MAGRKKLFKTYLLEHVTKEIREKDGIQIIIFKDLSEDLIPNGFIIDSKDDLLIDGDINKIVLCAEDVLNKNFRSYYKILSFENLENGKQIFNVVGLEKNQRSFYKESIVKIPDNLIEKNLLDKFLNSYDHYKKYKNKKR